MTDDPLTWTRQELADDVKGSLNSLIEDRINFPSDYRWVLPQNLQFPGGTPPRLRMPKTVHKWKIEELLQWKAALDQGRLHLQSIDPSRAEKKNKRDGRKSKNKKKDEKKRTRSKKAEAKLAVEVVVDNKFRKEDYKVVVSEDSEDDIIELSNPTSNEHSTRKKEVIDLTSPDHSESSDDEMEPPTPTPQQSAPRKPLIPPKLPTEDPDEHYEFSDFFHDDDNPQNTLAVRNPRPYIDQHFKRAPVMKDFGETVVSHILRGSEMKSVATSVSEAAWEKRRVSAEAEVNFLEEEIQQALSALTGNFTQASGGISKQQATAKKDVILTNGQVAMLVETLRMRSRQIVGWVAELTVVDALQAVMAAHRKQKGNMWGRACDCAHKYADEKKALVDEHNNEVTILQEELENVRSNIKQSNMENDAQIRQDTAKYNSNLAKLQRTNSANAQRVEKLSDDKVALEQLLKKANQLAAENLEKVQKLEENHSLENSMLTQRNNAENGKVSKLRKKKGKKLKVKEQQPDITENEEQVLKPTKNLDKKSVRKAEIKELQEQLVESMEENVSSNARIEDLEAQVRELQRQLDSPSTISITDSVTMSEGIETPSIPKKQNTVPLPPAASEIANGLSRMKKVTPILPPIPAYLFTRLATAPPPPTTFLPIAPAKSNVPHKHSNTIKREANSVPATPQPTKGTSSKVVPTPSARKRQLEDHDDDKDLTRGSRKQKKSKHDTSAFSPPIETINHKIEDDVEGMAYLPLKYQKSEKEKKPNKSKKNRITPAPPAASNYKDGDQLKETKFVPLTSKQKKTSKDAEIAPTPPVETSNYEEFDGLKGVEYHPLTYAKLKEPRKVKKDKKRKA